MRWNILLFSPSDENQEMIHQNPKVERYCEVIPTFTVEQTIENYLFQQSEIVIICSDVSRDDLRKVKKVLHQINSNLVIIENFDFFRYNMFEEIKKAIDLYNKSNSDLFSVKFSPN